ncbi:MAG: fucosyltransferase [Thermosynechococcus sp.]|uniref:glycosyltransferase family 10 domain-containing protein n=1 Tax=Thermosynechococcus sp. TaxID=2814275 RepID=UPI0022025A0E|nr:glycosyltransferase family 10 [Thermosynechococcus sp.]BCX12806.1 MAG: fucosyltransferase [Thermosynechococcus sp.]
MIGLLKHNYTIPLSSIFDAKNIVWVALKNAFEQVGCHLLTEDVIGSQQPDFELHLDVHARSYNVPLFVVLNENSLVYPPNGNLNWLRRQYRWCFSWDPQLAHLGIATKIQLPHSLGEGVVDGYKNRPQLVVMIASNKRLAQWWSPQNLYPERIRAIRWFEEHAPADFELYGHLWTFSSKFPKQLSFITHPLEKVIPRWLYWQPSSWRGVIPTKREVLEKARFSIVYENVKGLQGYITEKIFDAFCAGNVPIYWGAEDVTDYIPAECMIDRRQFKSYNELYEFIRGMPEETYIDYQRAICHFLASEAAQAFSVELFAQTVVQEILKRLPAAQ